MFLDGKLSRGYICRTQDCMQLSSGWPWTLDFLAPASPLIGIRPPHSAFKVTSLNCKVKFLELPASLPVPYHYPSCPLLLPQGQSLEVSSSGQAPSELMMAWNAATTRQIFPSPHSSPDSVLCNLLSSYLTRKHTRLGIVCLSPPVDHKFHEVIMPQHIQGPACIRGSGNFY